LDTLISLFTPALFQKDFFYNKHLTDKDTDFSEKTANEDKRSIRRFLKRLRRRCKTFGVLTVFRFAINRSLKELLAKVSKRGGC